MLKQFLIITLLAVSVLASTEIFELDYNAFAIDISTNIFRTNYTDVVITYKTTPTAITNGYFSSFICVKQETDSFSLDYSNTSMIGFSFEVQCGTTCATSDDLTKSEWVSYIDIHGAYLVSSPDNFTTTTTVTSVFPTNANRTSIATEATVYYIYYGMTPANLLTMGLPAQGVQAYYRCWGAINYSSTKAYREATVVTISALTDGFNITLNINYSKLGNAILAITALAVMNLSLNFF